ncbi:hypothetical protein [Pandoraea sp.]
MADMLRQGKAQRCKAQRMGRDANHCARRLSLISGANIDRLPGKLL